MKKKIIIIIILIAATFTLFVLIEKNEEGGLAINPRLKTMFRPSYYPDTAEAPVLELAWEGELDPNTATRYTPYGVWEGWFEYPEGTAYEPANEMQFYVITEASNFLAVAPGIVTQNYVFDKEVGLVSVQYGKNYAVTYLHILPRQDLDIGQQVETGDILGTMEKRLHPMFGEETWWEIKLTTRQDGKFRTLPPYDYFSDAGQAKLDELAYNFKEEAAYFSESGKPLWTIEEGCSWMKYTNGEGWWDSGRFFDNKSGDSEKEFLDNLGLGWKIGDENGRIIGPTDDCD